MRPADGAVTVPKLSVVVAAWSGKEELRRCLTAVLSQTRPPEDEIIVARNFALDGGDSLRREFPTVIDLPLARATPVPQLRGAGLAVARGTVVAFLEDHCACGPGWRDAIMRAYTQPFDAVGGPVDLAKGGHPLDWAVYFYDYARFTPPMMSGPVGSLSGANASYKHSFLQALGSTALQEGVLEVTLEREIHRRGLAMYLSSEAIVVHGKHHSAGHAIGLTFSLARGYASARVAGFGALKRGGLAAVMPLLPLLLLSRILSSAARTRRHLARLAMALPWLLLLLGAWSIGELTGYLAGAGASRQRWR